MTWQAVTMTASSMGFWLFFCFAIMMSSIILLLIPCAQETSAQRNARLTQANRHMQDARAAQTPVPVPDGGPSYALECLVALRQPLPQVSAQRVHPAYAGSLASNVRCAALKFPERGVLETARVLVPFRYQLGARGVHNGIHFLTKMPALFY